MPDLLLEFFSEEIPARMQPRAMEDLKKLVTDRLVNAGLVYEGAKAFATPRRIALAVHGLPVKQKDVREQKKGPRVGAADNAIAGFLKSAGLNSIDQAKKEKDDKGEFYVAVLDRPGRAAIEVIAEIVPDVVKVFPWPKSMNWGSPIFIVTNEGDYVVDDEGRYVIAEPWLKWVRPLHSIVATFGPETEEPEIVQFEVGGIKSSNETQGHRFMAPQSIKVKRLEDYVAKLHSAKVVVDPARRAEMIRADARNLTFAQGFELVEDEGLLAEVVGLVEWPVVLIGAFDRDFLAIPDEVIRATIRNNQKCFVVRDPQTHKLVNKFIIVSNMEAVDGGNAIITGNERVIRARLSDAKFFYETDLKTKLEGRLPKFKDIVFHEKLGTQAERIERITKLAVELAPLVKADPEKVERAAKLAKADLLTEVVGEFPELQGLMGKYYALTQGEDKAVAAACEDHYKPLGPSDRVPTDPVSIAVALADKIDALVGFWAIDEKPTGSKDPYALRRAALGVIRIVLSNNLRIRISGPIFLSLRRLTRQVILEYAAQLAEALAPFEEKLGRSDWVPEFLAHTYRSLKGKTSKSDPTYLFAQNVIALLNFFADRLKVQLRDQGARHDLVDAVFALESQDDLLMIVRRVEALGKFLDTEDGKNLLAGAKRAANIIRIEEKKDKKDYDGAPDAKLYQLPEEKALAKAIDAAKKDASAAIAKEDFAAAMTAMAKLRPAVDAFFDKVTVNVEDRKLRENRLKLLNEIREATRAVADFSKVEG